MKYRGIFLTTVKSSGLIMFRYDNKLYRGIWSLAEAKTIIDNIKKLEKEKHYRVLRQEKLMQKLLRVLDFGKEFKIEFDLNRFHFTGKSRSIETATIKNIKVNKKEILFSTE